MQRGDACMMPAHRPASPRDASLAGRAGRCAAAPGTRPGQAHGPLRPRCTRGHPREAGREVPAACSHLPLAQTQCVHAWQRCVSGALMRAQAAPHGTHALLCGCSSAPCVAAPFASRQLATPAARVGTFADSRPLLQRPSCSRLHASCMRPPPACTSCMRPPCMRVRAAPADSLLCAAACLSQHAPELASARPSHLLFHTTLCN